MTLPLSYRPLPKQEQFHRLVSDGVRYVVMLGGRDSGKTYPAAREMLRQVWLPHPENDPRYAYIVAPTYRLLEESRKKFEDSIEDMQRAAPQVQVRPEPLKYPLRGYRFSNNFCVELRSGEIPANLRADKLSFAWLDEPSGMSPEVFRILQPAFLLTGGQMIFTTTPLDPLNWVSKLVEKALVGNSQYGLVVQRTDENKYLSKEAYEQLVKEYPGQWKRRELDAEIFSFEGLCYPEYETIEFDQRSWKQILGNRDVRTGFVRDTEGSVIVGEDGGAGSALNVWVWAWKRGTPEHPDYVVVDAQSDLQWTLGDMATRWREHPLVSRVTATICDPHAKRDYEELAAKGIPCEMGEIHRVETGIRHVSGLFREHRLKIARHLADVIRELELYCWKKARGSEEIGTEPIDKHNDFLDALRNLLYTDHVRGQGYEPQATYVDPQAKAVSHAYQADGDGGY